MTNDLQRRILEEEARRRAAALAQPQRQAAKSATPGQPPPGVDSTTWLQQQYREQITNPPSKALPPAPAPIPAQPPAVTAPTGDNAYTQAIQQAQQVRQPQKPVIPDVRPVTPAGTNAYTMAIRQGQQLPQKTVTETPFIKSLPIKPQRFHEIEKQGEIVTVERTTNPDKFIARVEIPEKPGQYIQTFLTREEILERGAEVPVSGSGWWFKAGSIGERMVQTGGITEKDITKAYTDLGLTPPDFTKAPRDVVGITKDGMLAGYKDEAGDLYIPHPSTFSSIAAASKYANSITNATAKAAYIKAFGYYWGMKPENVITELPGDKERAAAKLGYKSVKDEGFQIFLERFKKDPYAKEFTVTEAGGKYSQDDKKLLSKAAGVNWNYDGEMRRSFVPTGNRMNPEYIGIVEFGKLSEADRMLITKVGVSAFNAVKQARYADYIADQPLAWRTLYNQNIKAGMDKAEALLKATTDYNAYADRVNASRAASRTKADRELAEYNATTAVQVVTAAELDELTKKQQAALAAMEPYKTKDGKYRLFQALLEGFNETKKTGDNAKQKEILQAASMLFDKNKLEELRQTREWLWDITPPGRDIQREGVLGDWDKAYAALPGGLVAAAGATKGTPVPHDDILALIILSAVASGKMVADRIAEYKNKNKAPISEATIAVLDQYNNMTLLDPKTFMPPGGITLGPEKKILLTDEKLIPPRMPDQQEKIKVIRQPLPLEQLIPANVKAVLLLPTPGTRARAEDSILMAQALKVREAEREVLKNIPAAATKEIPIDYNKILEEANTELERKKVFDDINEALARLSTSTTSKVLLKQMDKYETAHQEYLRKLRLWANAWQSYVQSIQPTPVKGSVTPEIKAVLARAMLQQKQPKVNLQPGQAGEEAVSVNVIAETAVNKSIKQALKQLGSTYTKAELKTALKVAYQQALQTALKQAMAQKTATQTQTQVQTAVRQAVATATDELTRTLPRAIPLTAEMTATTKLTGKKIKIPKLPKGKFTDEEKRALIRERGVTTYNMGKLHGKDVWWTHLDTGENVVVLGEKPEGAKLTADGKGSADKTAQRIGKLRDFKPFSIRHGAVVSRVTPLRAPKGATARFGPSSPSAIGRSRKVGKMYVTELGSSKMLGFSKKPLGRRRGKRR